MKTKILKVKITFLEPVLGTWPSNQNVARDFIASKSPDGCHDRGRGCRSAMQRKGIAKKHFDTICNGCAVLREEGQGLR
nr:MAG TPA: hypothetical protein [Caudoviricetes sp.]